MKIFYAFSGHGHGHAVRSSVVIKYLRKLGHQIKAATYSQGLKFAENIGLDVVEINGFRMYYSRGGLSGSKTLFHFFNRSPQVILSNLFRLRKVLNDFQPDLIISDFEPFSAYWAKWKNLPLITINNQSMINQAKIRIPQEYLPNYLLAKALVAIFSPKAQANFILSFSPKLTPLKKRYQKNSFLIPPILREKIFSLQPKKEDFILVYQTSPVYQKKLSQIFKQFLSVKFYLYNIGSKLSSDKNITIKNFSEEEFLNDLANCRAVITNGGFGLMSEAIYLGKPILSLPIKGDIEQILNAILLKRCGYGKFGQKINYQTLRDFFDNLTVYEKNLKNYYQEGNKIFEEKLKDILTDLF